MKSKLSPMQAEDGRAVYWIISSDGSIAESCKPICCELEGLTLEPLDHVSAARLEEEVVVRPQGSRFVIVRNIGGIAVLYRGQDAEFKLLKKPYVGSSSHGIDSHIHLPSCQLAASNSYIDFSFPVGFDDSIWILFAVSDDDAQPSLSGARRRLHENLQGVFV